MVRVISLLLMKTRKREHYERLLTVILNFHGLQRIFEPVNGPLTLVTSVMVVAIVTRIKQYKIPGPLVLWQKC